MKDTLINNFFKYVKISSQSDASKNTLPTSSGQLELAQLLKKELEELNLSNIKLDENGILTACIKADESKKSIGFIAHLDTIDVGLSPNINAQILKFRGQDLDLGKAIFKVNERPEIKKYLNEEIIFSDGSSVLGADNKASVAILMTLAKEFANNKDIANIYFAFVPDEEIGLLGSKVLNLDDFCPDYAYTIDCCELGELMYETFNAASAKLFIKGVSAHPMNAYNIMLNPSILASEFTLLFDRLQSPENTKEKQGYIWINELFANQNEAVVGLNIRDHDKNLFEEKKDFIRKAVSFMQEKYKRAEFKLEINDTYSNIKDAMNDENKVALDKLKQAFKLCNIEPKIIPMRGGTDGSALSKRGLFVPNFFTGAHNFHSKFEFLPISSFLKSYEVARTLILNS